MTEYLIRDASLDDADLIAPILRDVDREEIAASSGYRPLRALRLSIMASSVCRVGLADGVPACIYGVSQATLFSDTGSIWMLGTHILQDHAVRFLRENRGEIEAMRQGLRRLENYCDARNRATLRWLKWLGFTIEAPQPYGVKELPFHYFWKDY